MFLLDWRGGEVRVVRAAVGMIAGWEFIVWGSYGE